VVAISCILSNCSLVPSPPLRERGDDILMIANAFIDKISRRLGKIVSPLNDENKKALISYSWPGNVRELQNVIEHSLIITTTDSPELTSLIPATENTTKQEFVTQPVIFTAAEFKEMEKKNIRLALDKSKISGKGGSAELLQIPATTLASRMKKLNIVWKLA